MPSIGYRRHDVRHALPGGWACVLPGRFGVEEEEDGTWHATDARLDLRFSAVTYADLGEDAPDTGAIVTAFAGEEAGEAHWLPDRRRDALYARACVGSSLERRALCACFSCGPELAFLTILFDTDAEELAVSIWRSLERRPGA